MSASEVVPKCDKCGADKVLTKAGARSYRYRCRPCHAENMRGKYRESRNRSVAKYTKTPKYKKMSRLSAKRKDSTAHNSRQRWTIAHDDLVSSYNESTASYQFTEGQLADMLGRTIYAVRHRRERLRASLGDPS